MRWLHALAPSLYVIALQLLQHILYIQALGMKSCSLIPVLDCDSFYKFLHYELQVWASKNAEVGYTKAEGVHLVSGALANQQKCFVFVPTFKYLANKSGMNFDIAKEFCENAGGMIPWFSKDQMQSDEANYMLKYTLDVVNYHSIWTGLVRWFNPSNHTKDWYWMCPNKLIKAEDNDIEWGPYYPKSNVTNEDVGIMTRILHHHDIKVEHEKKDDRKPYGLPWFCVAILPEPTTIASTQVTSANYVPYIILLVIIVLFLFIMALLLEFSMRRRHMRNQTSTSMLAVAHQYGENDIGSMTSSMFFKDDESETAGIVEKNEKSTSLSLNEC